MKNWIIDVDLLIDNYNKKNPTLKQMDRKTLASELGVNPQLFTDWKGGRTPKLVHHLFKMKEIGSCNIEDFIKEE